MIRDMELLLNSVHSDEIKEYMNEALRCYNASSYRACVVLSVIAGMQDLRNKINSVASTNPNIKRLDEEISIKEQELQTFEKYMNDIKLKQELIEKKINTSIAIIVVGFVLSLILIIVR